MPQLMSDGGDCRTVSATPSLKCQSENSKGCLVMILLREVSLVLLCVVLQLHSIIVGNHDFAGRRPIDFAARSPPIIFTLRTLRNKINYSQP